jgi:hypothetical protein
MSSKNETGHAVNLSNFKILIDKCTGFGAVYNPSNAKLKTGDMLTLWTAADASHQLLTAAVQSAKLPLSARFILFEPVDKLVTKTINYYKSTEASDQLINNAKTLANKYRGYAKSKKLEDGTTDPNAVSTSHLSYVQKADTFKQLIDLYISDANYNPNETDIQTATLTPIYNQMKPLNENIGTIIAPIEAARIARNHALYDVKTGMVDIALAAKDYVKGLFGATAPETKTISGLKFSRI